MSFVDSLKLVPLLAGGVLIAATCAAQSSGSTALSAQEACRQGVADGPIRRFNEDLGKIGLKGSPTVVSKVFGPTPRSQRADTMVVADTTVEDVCLNLLEKIFTTHPILEEEIVARAGA